MRALFLLLLVFVACSEPPKKVKPKEQVTNKESKEATPKKEEPKELPTPIQPDLGPVDLYEWEFKSTAEAQDKIRACAGYQADADNLSLNTFKEASPSSPYWVFEVHHKNQEKTDLIAYCTVIPRTSEIQCSPQGAICP